MEQLNKDDIIREVPPRTKRKVIAQQVYVAPGGRNFTQAKIDRMNKQSEILAQAIAQIEDVHIEDTSIVRYDGY